MHIVNIWGGGRFAYLFSCPSLLKPTRVLYRGGGTGEASEARASPEFRGFSTEKFLTSWIYEGGNFSGFTGKKLVPTPLCIILYDYSQSPDCCFFKQPPSCRPAMTTGGFDKYKEISTTY